MLRRRRLLAAKIESTAYTVESLLAADATFQAYDVILQPTVEMVERPQLLSFVNNADSIGTQMGTCTFRLALNGDGAGGVPGWASTLLPACGFVDSSGTFNATTEAPGSNVKTLTMATYVDGVVKTIKGAVGAWTATLEAGRPVFLDFIFIGSLVADADAALLAPTLNTRAPLRFGAATTTIGSYSPRVHQVVVDSGNNAVMRPDASSSTGFVGGYITDRNSTITITREKTTVATEAAANTTGLFADWLAGTTRTVSAVMTDDADQVTISASCSPNNMQEGEADGIVTDELPYKVSQPNQLSIDFDAAP